MALNKTALKNGIKQLHDDMMQKQVDSNEEYATRLSDLIDGFVKTGTVNAGIAVSTTGTAAAQTGVTTGTGTIS